MKRRQLRVFGSRGSLGITSWELEGFISSGVSGSCMISDVSQPCRTTNPALKYRVHGRKSSRVSPYGKIFLRAWILPLELNTPEFFRNHASARHLDLGGLTCSQSIVQIIGDKSLLCSTEPDDLSGRCSLLLIEALSFSDARRCLILNLVRAGIWLDHISSPIELPRSRRVCRPRYYVIGIKTGTNGVILSMSKEEVSAEVSIDMQHSWRTPVE